MNGRVATFVAAVVLFVLWSKSGCIQGGFWVASRRLVVLLARSSTMTMFAGNDCAMGFCGESTSRRVARLHRHWAGLPKATIAVPPQYRATADDLDLFGHASLFQLLNLASTLVGKRVLRDWLLEPADPAENSAKTAGGCGACAVLGVASNADARRTSVVGWRQRHGIVRRNGRKTALGWPRGRGCSGCVGAWLCRSSP